MALPNIRTIRPRVYLAIHNLGIFTISELCREAQLEDRAQAYSQIRDLKARGFLEERTLPASGAHAPLKEYSLASSRDKRSEFAEAVAAYSLSLSKATPQSSPPAQSDLAEAALAEANIGLAKIEILLADLESDPSMQPERIRRLDSEFEAAWTNIETARLEYSDGDHENGSVTLAQMVSRWQAADTRRSELSKSEAKKQASRVEWSVLLTAAASLVGRTLGSGSLSGAHRCSMDNIAAQLSTKLRHKHRAPLEMLLDEIRADSEYAFSPVFRHALRTEDASVVFTVTEKLKDVNLAWWRYNFENACYLRSEHFHMKNWLAAYAEVLKQLSQEHDQRPCAVYSCDLERLTEDVYLDMTDGRGVSLVSPREISYLTSSEVIRPTMLMSHGNVLESVACAFLKPDDCLYAYGPIANDISRWSGAAELRVAACLGMWGLPLGKSLQDVMQPLKKGKALIALEGKNAKLTAELSRIVNAEEIGACVAA